MTGDRWEFLLRASGQLGPHRALRLLGYLLEHICPFGRLVGTDRSSFSSFNLDELIQTLMFEADEFL